MRIQWLTDFKLGARVSKIHDRISITHALVFIIFSGCATLELIPANYVARANAHGSASYNAWIRARPANDFTAMIHFLEKTLDLSREYASFFAPYEHIADPMIDEADEGLTTATIQHLFAELRRELVPMVHVICDQLPADDNCLHRSFAEVAQLGFGLYRGFKGSDRACC